MIISASRRTDIPAFYAEWFFRRLQEGFVLVRNPMNAKQISRILLNTDVVDCFVFWTKNPAPMLDKLRQLESYNYYFQFTLTPYDNTIEKRVPDKRKLIDTFKKVSDRIGPEKVIWRYDPIFYTDAYDYARHIDCFGFMAKELASHTQKCIVSFLDVYRKCVRNMRGIAYRPLSKENKFHMARAISDIAKSYRLTVTSCAEETDLSPSDIHPGKCIDDALIEKISGLRIAVPRDKTQRSACRCVSSIDIGAYNSCNHNCLYCYANFDHLRARKNYEVHDPNAELLCDRLNGNEKITTRKMKRLSQDINLHEKPQ